MPRVTGKRSVKQAELERPLPAPIIDSNTSPFFLAFHPKRWAVDNGRIIPALARIVVEPGINGHDRRKHPDRFLADFKDRGWLIIERDAVSEGYMMEYKNDAGRTVYMAEYEILHSGSEVVSRDDQAFFDFIDALMEAEIVPSKPELYILEGMADSLRNRINDYEMKATTAATQRAEKMKADLEVVLKEIEACQSEKQKTPVRRVSGKRSVSKED